MLETCPLGKGFPDNSLNCQKFCPLFSSTYLHGFFPPQTTLLKSSRSSQQVDATDLIGVSGFIRIEISIPAPNLTSRQVIHIEPILGAIRRLSTLYVYRHIGAYPYTHTCVRIARSSAYYENKNILKSKINSPAKKSTYLRSRIAPLIIRRKPCLLPSPLETTRPLFLIHRPCRDAIRN